MSIPPRRTLPAGLEKEARARSLGITNPFLIRPFHTFARAEVKPIYSAPADTSSFGLSINIPSTQQYDPETTYSAPFTKTAYEPGVQADAIEGSDVSASVTISGKKAKKALAKQRAPDWPTVESVEAALQKNANSLDEAWDRAKWSQQALIAHEEKQPPKEAKAKEKAVWCDELERLRKKESGHVKFRDGLGTQRAKLLHRMDYVHHRDEQIRLKQLKQEQDAEERQEDDEDTVTEPGLLATNGDTGHLYSEDHRQRHLKMGRKVSMSSKSSDSAGGVALDIPTDTLATGINDGRDSIETMMTAMAMQDKVDAALRMSQHAADSMSGSGTPTPTATTFSNAFRGNNATRSGTVNNGGNIIGYNATVNTSGALTGNGNHTGNAATIRSQLAYASGTASTTSNTSAHSGSNDGDNYINGYNRTGHHSHRGRGRGNSVAAVRGRGSVSVRGNEGMHGGHDTGSVRGGRGNGNANAFGGLDNANASGSANCGPGHIYGASRHLGNVFGPTPAQAYGQSYGQVGGYGTGHGAAGYGTAGYGNAGYGNAGYGHAAHGNAGYGHAPYGNAGYGHGAYGNAGYGHAPYGNAGYGHAGYGHAAYGNAGYSHAAYGSAGYGHAGYGNTGYGTGGYGAAGYGAAGHGTASSGGVNNNGGIGYASVFPTFGSAHGTGANAASVSRSSAPGSVHGTNTNTGTVTNAGTGTASASGSIRGTNTGIVIGTATATATGMVTGTGTNIGTVTNTSGGTASASGSVRGTNTGSVTGTGTGTSTNTGTVANTGTGTAAASGSVRGTNTGTATGICITTGPPTGGVGISAEQASATRTATSTGPTAGTGHAPGTGTRPRPRTPVSVGGNAVGVENGFLSAETRERLSHMFAAPYQGPGWFDSSDPKRVWMSYDPATEPGRGQGGDAPASG